MTTTNPLTWLIALTLSECTPKERHAIAAVRKAAKEVVTIASK